MPRPSNRIDRRTFLQDATQVIAAGSLLGNLSCRTADKRPATQPATESQSRQSTPTHIVTLSFDDGFRKSCLKIASIYEKYELPACFNIVATGHWDTFVAPDKGQAGYPKGDFHLWNELQARGHEIMPHGYKHANKATLPFHEAQQLILDCLAIFSQQLAHFESKQAVFNFPYNQSTPQLEAWLPSVVRAFRAGGGGINPLPSSAQVKLTTTGYGPANCEQHLDSMVEKLLARPSGWLIYNTHGVDDEGWGPIGSDYLDRLLNRLLSVGTVRILPTAKALTIASSQTSSLQS